MTDGIGTKLNLAKSVSIIIPLVISLCMIGYRKRIPADIKLKKASQESSSPYGKSNVPKCIKEGEPDDVPGDWRVRFPAFVLLGTMKGGTSSLSHYVREHPLVVKPNKLKEQHFLDKHFDKYETEDGILRKQGRDAYASFLIADAQRVDKSHYALDDSPLYLFWSTLTPPRLLCVAPWVKLVVVLRNPIDRAFSHFNMMGPSVWKNASFEDWISRDFKRLLRFGLVGTRNNLTHREEWHAWRFYTGEAEKKKWKFAVLGKGMYSTQIRHWQQAMKAFGKPPSDLLVLRSDDLLYNTTDVVARVYDFLGLPSFNLTRIKKFNKRPYKDRIRRATRQKLESFFQPYNRQLHDLLGPDWKDF